jgi:SAM-dependent methyltransferase
MTSLSIQWRCHLSVSDHFGSEVAAWADWTGDFFDDGFQTTFDMLGVYQHTAAEVDALVSLLNLPTGAHILDVPCGFGRHAGPLQQRGYRVTGVDNSSTQLNDARARHPDVDFVLTDMRTPPPGPYDAVLNLWTSFGMLDTAADDRAALDAWAGALASDGTLVMQLNTFEQFEAVARRGGETTSTQRMDHGPLAGVARYNWPDQEMHVRWRRPGWHRVGKLRMYSRPQLAALLSSAGFSRLRFAADFAGNPVTASGLTVIVARR